MHQGMGHTHAQLGMPDTGITAACSAAQYSCLQPAVILLFGPCDLSEVDPEAASLMLASFSMLGCYDIPCWCCFLPWRSALSCELTDSGAALLHKR